MFEGLTKRFQDVFRDIAGYGKLTEKNINDSLHKIRTSLLEADVNYKVVKDFVQDIKEKAIGRELFKQVTPAQMLLKIVYEELTGLLGSETARLNLSAQPSIIMMIGLHGGGKTTTCAKLAAYLKEKGKKPLLVALDLVRPAAVTQLKTLGEKLDIPVYEPGLMQNAVKVCGRAIDYAKSNSRDVVILDTAGRWHIENDLLDELKEIKRLFLPRETILIVDSTTGQDAVNIAGEFNEKIGIDGIILTKVDGDSRGGAAVSARAVTGRPIKFVGTGEHFNDLEEFHPDRMASRILGMGDVITLVEKIEKAAKEEEKRKEEQKKQKKHEIDLEEFLRSIKQIKKIAPMADLLKMMPLGGALGSGALKADGELKRIEAIISSMTPYERRHPEIIDGSRKKRISSGSGTTPHDVNLLLSRFEKMKESMKKMQKGMGPLGKGFQMPKGFNFHKGGFPFPPKF